MTRLIWTALVLSSSVGVLAQQPAPQRSFEVVSIKPSPPNAPNRLPPVTPTRVEIYNTTLHG